MTTMKMMTRIVTEEPIMLYEYNFYVKVQLDMRDEDIRGQVQKHRWMVSRSRYRDYLDLASQVKDMIS